MKISTLKTFNVSAVVKFLSNRAAFQLFTLSAVLKNDAGPEFITIAKLSMDGSTTAEIELLVPAHDQQDAESRVLELFGNNEEYSVRVLARQVLTAGGTLIETADEQTALLAHVKGTSFRQQVASALRTLRSQDRTSTGRCARVVLHKGRPVALPTGKKRPSKPATARVPLVFVEPAPWWAFWR